MRSLTCYTTPGKQKSRLLLEAFAASVPGAHVELDVPLELEDGAAAFYGVTAATRHLWKQAQFEGRDWYYIDNAYFDRGRGEYFRITKNAMQADGRGRPDWQRLARLNLNIRPWKKAGAHIVVAMQSEPHFRVLYGLEANSWMRGVLESLRRHTERSIVVRHWVADKRYQAETLQLELQSAWALVTHTSAAANEAVIAGVPAFCTGMCSALAMGCSELSRIEDPERPTWRHEWAAALAARQWTIEEMRQGIAWRAFGN